MSAIKVKYENGVFLPLEKITLENGKEATVILEEKEKGKVSGFSGIWKDDDEIEKVMQEILSQRKHFRAQEIKL